MTNVCLTTADGEVRLCDRAITLISGHAVATLDDASDLLGYMAPREIPLHDVPPKTPSSFVVDTWEGLLTVCLFGDDLLVGNRGRVYRRPLSEVVDMRRMEEAWDE